MTNILTLYLSYINKILVKKLHVFVIVYLDNIFIYIENKRKKYVKAVQLELNKLQKHLLYANLKKYEFYQKKEQFLGFIISHQGI